MGWPASGPPSPEGWPQDRTHGRGGVLHRRAAAPLPVFMDFTPPPRAALPSRSCDEVLNETPRGSVLVTALSEQSRRRFWKPGGRRASTVSLPCVHGVCAWAS